MAASAGSSQARRGPAPGRPGRARPGRAREELATKPGRAGGRRSVGRPPRGHPPSSGGREGRSVCPRSVARRVSASLRDIRLANGCDDTGAGGRGAPASARVGPQHPPGGPGPLVDPGETREGAGGGLVEAGAFRGGLGPLAARRAGRAGEKRSPGDGKAGARSRYRRSAARSPVRPGNGSRSARCHRSGAGDSCDAPSRLSRETSGSTTTWAWHWAIATRHRMRRPFDS